MGIGKILSMIDLAGSEKRLKAYQEVAAKILPKHIDPNKYMALYINIAKGFANNEKVTKKDSILKCLFNAPKLGLNPDPVFGQIYFIPYKGVLTYQTGYRGMITMADNAGLRVRAGIVYEKDEFDYFEKEDGQHFLHRPILSEKNRGKEICVYSAFQDVKSGFNQIQVMESYHVDEIKKLVLARMKDASTPWKDPLFEPEMRKKTGIRRHAKTEPFSESIARVIEHEEKDERGEETVDNHEELDGILDAIDIGGEAHDQEQPDDATLPIDQQALPFK
jgi:phage RecT family recombinase